MEPHPKLESYPRRSPERWLRGYLRDHFAGSIAAVDIAKGGAARDHPEQLAPHSTGSSEASRKTRTGCGSSCAN